MTLYEIFYFISSIHWIRSGLRALFWVCVKVVLSVEVERRSLARARWSRTVHFEWLPLKEWLKWSELTPKSKLTFVESHLREFFWMKFALWEKFLMKNCVFFALNELFNFWSGLSSSGKQRKHIGYLRWRNTTTNQLLPSDKAKRSVADKNNCNIKKFHSQYYMNNWSL